MDIKYVLILLVNIHTIVTVKSYEKKINNADYLYPDYFWQFDYSTGAGDVLENKSPTVHGKILRISGDGRGFLTYKASDSSATLGSFSSPCFVDYSKCTSGMTISFWTRIARVVTSYEGKQYQLLTVKPKGYGDKAPSMRIWYVIHNGRLTLNIMTHSANIQSFQKEVSAGQWYHVIIENKAKGNGNELNVYVNMEPLQRSTSGSRREADKSVELFLGKSIDRKVDSAYENADICLDNLAIWKRTLNDSAKRKIYLAELGKIDSIQLTGNKEKPFEIRWRQSYDYYSHIKTYTVYWWTGDDTTPYPNKLVYPVKGSAHVGKNLQADLEIFKSNREYTVRVQADTTGKVDLYKQEKITVPTSKVKGSEVKMFSDTPMTIKILWKVGLNNQRSDFVIGYNKSKSGDEERTITSTSLDHELNKLTPRTMYKVQVTKQSSNSKYQVVYTKYVKTISVVESVDSSIMSAQILNYNNSSVYLQFDLFPDLNKYWDIDYKLLYTISTRELYNPQAKPKIAFWEGPADFVYLLVDHLTADTTYSIDVELKEKGYHGDGIKMKIPLVFTLKEFYKPPITINLVKSTPGSITVRLSFPNSVINNTKVITHVKLFVNSSKGKTSVSIVSLDQSDKLIEALDQYTDYNVSAATGDGTTFGKVSRNFRFKTKDLNECLKKVNPCPNSMLCQNTIGSFNCNCRKGFSKINNRCDDVNECLRDGTCGNNEDCLNTESSFKCTCKKGYQKIGGQCTDVNECLRDGTCGDNENCLNTEGSFKCTCKKGYQKVGGQCTDVNECLRDGTCGHNEDCHNTEGSFKCTCKKGHQKVGGQCTDVNECLRDGTCGDNEDCLNTEGSFKCTCKKGYQKTGGQCTDTNECRQGSTMCPQNAICKNKPGSFECVCKVGFTRKEDACIDVDECQINGSCGVDSHMKVCANNVGSFHCHCRYGYTEKNKRCIDINECEKRGSCGDEQTCVNTPGSFSCSCAKGYIMRQKQCIDINECLKPNFCGVNGTCVNKPGGYECECKPGYESGSGKNGFDCVDINECLVSKKCGQYSVCENTAGSFHCNCYVGFQKENGACRDIDECMNSDRCGDNSDCINTPGSSRCNCKRGFVRRGNRCSKVAEDKVVFPCYGEETRNIHWPETYKERTIIVDCPMGSIGNASRSCLKGADQNLHWGDLDLSGCVSGKWKKIMALKNRKAKSTAVATSLGEFVKQEIFGGDVSNVVEMMGSLVTEESGEKTNDIFTEMVITVTSDMLNEQTRVAWNDLPQEKRSEDADLLLSTADNLIKASAESMKKKKSKTVIRPNVEMKLRQISKGDGNDLNYRVAGSTVTLPEDSLQLDVEPVVVAIVSYKGLSNLIGVPSNTVLKANKSKYLVNSDVTSVSLYPQKMKTFTQPVLIVHELAGTINNTDPHCAFWDADKMLWSDQGCSVFSANTTHVTCQCFHLTSFVILMTVTELHPNITEPHRFALGLITTIGISLSLVALIASFITFLFVRTIRSIRNTIHKHLVFALFIAQIVFLFGIERVELKIGCQVIAAIIHYFFLVSFFIMGLEGFVLYFMLVRVYKSLGTSGYGSIKYVIWCWVLPIIFILINLIIDDGAYDSQSEFCWLSLRNGYIWSFVGPVLLIIVSNFFILCMTLRVMTEKAKKRTNTVDEIWFWMKGSCLLLSILGVTWVLGIFYVDQQTVFMAYLFNVINSLQGFSIFVFHCMCDPRVRKAYYQFLCCLNYKEQSLLRTNTRSTRMFSNASKASLKNKKGNPYLDQDREKHSYTNGTAPAEVSLMSSPGGTSTANDSFAVLVGATKL